MFTAVDPLSEPDVELSYDTGKPRMVPYRLKWERHHDAVYWFDLKIAQDKGLVLWHTCCEESYRVLTLKSP